MSTMNTELFEAAERTFHASGSKPKDVSDILAKLESEHGVVCSVEGGLLTMTQNGAPASVGQVLAAFKSKNERAFFGGAGQVNFKDDLQGDNAAKSRFIAEHGFDEWNRMPLNEKSAGGRNVTTDAIPHAGMKSKDYARLTTAEKSKLISEIGYQGVQKILARS
jgi:hypothetical protein